MVPQRIEREILIDAPVEVVWAVVTEPEHISGWFSDAVELDLRPGGEAILRWNDGGTIHARVEQVEPPRLFSFRWLVRADAGLGADNATLVEFRLASEGDRTRLTVVESGFADLALPEEAKQQRFDGHDRGWDHELAQLVEHVGRR